MISQLRRILITGASGFVGRHLRLALERTHPNAEILTKRFDVTDADVVLEAMQALRPDALIHLAAVTTIAAARNDPDRAWRVNLNGTLNLARAMIAYAPNALFLFVSSADAYGNSFQIGNPIDETVPLAPTNTYGATKAAADLALGAMAAREGLRLVRMRPFNHTGPGQEDGFVVPAFARQIMRIKAGKQLPEMLVGALEPERDFLDVRDICAGYTACLGMELPPGQVVNLASGQPRRIGDVLDAMLDLVGIQVEIKIDPVRLRSGVAIPRAAGDAGLALRMLGWKPRIEWQQTLRDVLEDWRTRENA